MVMQTFFASMSNSQTIFNGLEVTVKVEGKLSVNMPEAEKWFIIILSMLRALNFTYLTGSFQLTFYPL